MLVTNGRRDEFVEKFQAEHVDLRPFFFPLSSQDLYAKYTFSNEVSQRIASQGVNVPTLPSLEVELLAKQLENMGV
jgi:dTDP-4-amino-4,6-dideoxygalactose transaminase